MDLRRLRSATEADHKAVEDCMPLMSPDLSRATYLAVLERLYGIVLAWDALAESNLTGPLQSLARQRQRHVLLEHDIRCLGASPDASRKPELPSFQGLPEILGAMYVMEGSRLGGQLIARHVEATLGDDLSHASSFFKGFADETGARWKEFLHAMQSNIPDSETDHAVEGAKKMFRAFGQWMRQSAVSCDPVPSTR